MSRLRKSSLAEGIKNRIVAQNIAGRTKLHDKQSIKKKVMEEKKEEIQRLLESMGNAVVDNFINDEVTKRRREIEQLRELNPYDPSVIQYNEYKSKEEKLVALVDYMHAKFSGIKVERQVVLRWVAATSSIWPS